MFAFRSPDPVRLDGKPSELLRDGIPRGPGQKSKCSRDESSAYANPKRRLKFYFQAREQKSFGGSIAASQEVTTLFRTSVVRAAGQTEGRLVGRRHSDPPASIVPVRRMS